MSDDLSIKTQFEKLQSETSDLYHFLNHFRDWVNQVAVNYEIFLEDEWFENRTTIEYTLRCLDTLNTLVFAKDDYHNSRDAKGVWHLGAYITTYWTIETPWDVIEAFILDNEPIRYRLDP